MGVSFCCVCDKLGRFRVSECVLCVEEFGVGLWQFVLCCLLDILGRVFGSE